MPWVRAVTITAYLALAALTMTHPRHHSGQGYGASGASIEVLTFGLIGANGFLLAHFPDQRTAIFETVDFDFWSEWQDLRLRVFGIEISIVFHLRRLSCVLTLCS